MRLRWQGFLWALGASVAVTALATPLSGWLELTNIVMLYLVGVVAVAMRFGRAPAAMAALMNVLAFDFFFVSPRLSFAVSDVQYIVTFAVMLGVGLLVGQLTAGLRFAAGVSLSRERRAQSLFELTRELSAALETRQVIEIGTAAVQGYFGGRAVVMALDASDCLQYPDELPVGLDRSVADWTLRQGQSAGLATNTLAAQTWRYVPLKAPMRVRGVLALEPAQPRWLLIPEQSQQLDTLARQIAIALERVHYVNIAQQAVVDMESERLRNALLGAVRNSRSPWRGERLRPFWALQRWSGALWPPEDSNADTYRLGGRGRATNQALCAQRAGGRGLAGARGRHPARGAVRCGHTPPRPAGAGPGAARW